MHQSGNNPKTKAPGVEFLNIVMDEESADKTRAKPGPKAKPAAPAREPGFVKIDYPGKRFAR